MAKKVPDNPYLAARYEWNERYGSYVRAATAWRTIGLVSMTMAVIGFGYALYQSTQVKLVPYIVEVDQLGNSAAGGFPAQIEYADERVVRAGTPTRPMRCYGGKILPPRRSTLGSAITRPSIRREKRRFPSKSTM